MLSKVFVTKSVTGIQLNYLVDWQFVPVSNSGCIEIQPNQLPREIQDTFCKKSQKIFT